MITRDSIVDDEVRAVAPIDELELAISKLPAVEFPLVHSFTPGIYVRQIMMPAGSVLTSMRHKTEHHFIVISGKIEVISENENEIYIGPFMGVTKPGTKRVLYAHTDTLWLTIHANPDDVLDPDELGESILEKFDNPLFKDDNPRINGWKKDISQSIGFINGIEPKEKLL